MHFLWDRKEGRVANEASGIRNPSANSGATFGGLESPKGGNNFSERLKMGVTTQN
jgi:hypothetical protein